jgi:8-oxo-dGTP diphosphatase
MIEVTCAIIVDGDGKVLVAQRSASMKLPLKMEFPGGKVEPGETPEAGLLREIKEELNLDVEIIAGMPATVHAYPDISIKLMPYVCRITGGSISLKEHAAYVWLVPGELIEQDWAEADIPVLHHYLSYLSLNNY